MDITDASSIVDADVSTTLYLFGTLEIEGVGIFMVSVAQSTQRKTWVLLNREFVETAGKSASAEDIVAILRIHNTGRMEGQGKTFLLTRLLENISVMVGRAATNKDVNAGFFVTGEYAGTGSDTSMIKFKASLGGGRYYDLDMVYEGYRLSLRRYNRKPNISIPRKLAMVEDEKTQAAMVAGLGVRTFSLLKRQRQHALDWYDKKDYVLIDTNEKFRDMLLEFLRAVQDACNRGKTLLTALDTETTGLNMLRLAATNPLRDYIVAIPFGWENDKAYVICTEMYYFSNVDADEIYPLFHTLFRRNVDYTYQQIELDYCGEHFSFSRQNILLVGANVDFDIRAFRSHDCDVFFDEDIQKLHYILATDWVQGKNSLKWMTHHYLQTETLELEDLFGPQHKDKYRYLSDPELALVYGGADADFPRVLWKKLRRLIPNNLYYLYKKYDMTAVYRTADATWQGMPVDEKGVREQGASILKDLDTLKDFIYRYAYAANRNNLSEKSAKLATLLGLDSGTLQEVQEIGDNDGMYRYPFTPANHKNLLFNILGYPVIRVSEKSQEPALDKFVLEKLASRKRDTPVEFLKADVLSAEAEELLAQGKEAEAQQLAPLVDKKKFNEDMYPLARVFQTYAKLNKEYTAYYKPIMQNDLEGRMFYNFSLQRAATRRILSPGQTMKGSLKKLVIAPPGKLFMCFDASQIEYRHMASLAYIQTKNLLKQEHPDDWEERLQESGIARIHRMMQNEEADYHIETASMMTGLPQYQVDHDTRKMYKSVGFGIPYGLGDRSMCENLFGKITAENMEKTKATLSDYKNRQFEIIRLLETVRDSAFIPAKIDDELREMFNAAEGRDKLGDAHVGIVRNFVGFYRLFFLKNLTRSATGRIRRQAGNCIIQGGAAELFRRMIYNFRMGCVNAGFADAVQWLMLVHDEVDTIVDADIDVCKLLDVIQTGCTLRYADHIPYYVGIGFGHNWYEAKDDAAELPVIMVNRLIEANRKGQFSIPSDGQQAENLLKLKRHYMCDRVGEELSKIVPCLSSDFEWADRSVDTVSDKFINYTVRSYLTTFLTKEERKKYDKKNPAPLQLQLERWQEARKSYGFENDFLTEKFADGREVIKNLVLDNSDTLEFVLDVNPDDMRIDLLESFDEDAAKVTEQENAQWFGEETLFDYSVPSDEILPDDTSDGYRYFKDDNGVDDDYSVNENPTNAFDLYVSSKYVRQHIFPSAPDTYTIMLNGTKYSKNSGVIVNAIRKGFGPGSGTILVIGTEIKKVVNVGCSDDKLDALDKIING